MAKTKDEVLPVGMVELCERLDLSRQRLETLRAAQRFPEPRWTVGGRPAWNWPDVEAWARETGRL